MKGYSWILSFGVIVSVVSAARQRWYYTGEYKFEKPQEEFFEGATLDLFSLYNHQAVDQSYLYSGGLILVPYNTLENKENATFSLESNDKIFIENIVGHPNLDIKSTSSYKIFLNPNYHRIPRFGTEEVMQAEIGLFDHDQEIFLEKTFNNVSIGTLHASLVLVLPKDNVSISMLHKIMWTWDSFGRNSLIHHTWHKYKMTTTSDDSHEVTNDNNDACLEDKSTSMESRKLRVMTYNLWHNNPPSWVYHDKRRRWDRYEARLLHFAEQVVRENPDLIAIQEVRLDTVFFHPKKHIPYWHENTRNATKLDSGSQIEHLLMAIDKKQQQLLTKEEQHTRPPYQVLYHPSMLQVDRERLVYRNEEGLLLLSKYPIVAAEALFLPREVGVTQDDHQRVALIMQVDVQSTWDTLCDAKANGEDEEQIVTLVTSHFSLYSPSREKGVQAIRRHLNRIDHTKRGTSLLSLENPLTTSEHTASHIVDTNPASGVVGESGPATSVRPSMAEILLGDFNAEPQEETIQYLLTPLSNESMNPDDINEVPFKDIWLLKHPSSKENMVIGKETIITEQMIDELGLTFPACKPIKRIDFILMRCPANEAAKAANNITLQNKLWTVSVDDVYVTGQAPTPDTEHLVGSRPDLGMQDLDSPIWASDHFAVVADLLLHPPHESFTSMEPLLDKSEL